MKLYSREPIIKKKAVELSKNPKRLDAYETYMGFLPDESDLAQQEKERPEGAYYHNMRKAFAETLAMEESSGPGGGGAVPAGAGAVPTGAGIVPAGAEVVPAGAGVVPAGGSGAVPAGAPPHMGLDLSDSVSLENEVKRILTEARQEAAALVEEAQARARKILAEARQQEGEFYQETLEALRRETLAQAVEEGREIGLQAGREEMDEGIRQVRGFYNMLERVWYDVLGKVDLDLLELALKISERIVGTVLKYDKDKLLSMIRSRILLPTERRNLKILVSEADWEWLRSLENKGLPPYPLVRDDGLKPGNVLIQSNEGIFDAQLETQLDKFREVLSEELINGQLESFGPKSQPH
jgi:flagellar assembly protein FliH